MIYYKLIRFYKLIIVKTDGKNHLTASYSKHQIFISLFN